MHRVKSLALVAGLAALALVGAPADKAHAGLILSNADATSSALNTLSIGDWTFQAVACSPAPLCRANNFDLLGTGFSIQSNTTGGAIVTTGEDMTATFWISAPLVSFVKLHNEATGGGGVGETGNDGLSAVLLPGLLVNSTILTDSQSFSALSFNGDFTLEVTKDIHGGTANNPGDVTLVTQEFKVPEPASFGMLGLGLFAFFMLRNRIGQRIGARKN
jgi:hypothetical protein